MSKNRLEAFSDGVLAIIITIMVLELHIPHGSSLADLKPLAPVFMSYILSFTFIGCYWGNHHHLLHTLTAVNSKIIWANIHLLFWLSLIPFATGWMGENEFARTTMAVYGALLLFCGIAYYVLQQTILKTSKMSVELQNAVKRQSKKGTISELCYLLSIPAALIFPVFSAVLFGAVLIMWIIPDRNIEEALKQKNT